MTKQERRLGIGNRNKSVGIKQIAEALGVSIGTVDRALHSRPGINPMTRTKVLKMAQTLGYRPNLAARFLKSQKQLRITVDLPREIASFFDTLREGIRSAASPFEPAVGVEFLSSQRFLDGQEAQLFQQAVDEESSGIIFAPSDPAKAKPLIHRAARKQIPVVCVATDAPGTERLTSVSADPLASGAIVGELMCRILHDARKFAVVAGSLSTEDHAEKVHGFKTSLQQFAPEAQLVSVIEAHDEEQEACDRTRELLRQHTDLGGIYVATANSLPVVRAVSDAGRLETVRLITTDLFPELVPMIRDGPVIATIHQRPFTQGRVAFQSLYQFLLEGTCPPARIKLVPHIVMASNLDLFIERLQMDLDEDDMTPLAVRASAREG